MLELSYCRISASLVTKYLYWCCRNICTIMRGGGRGLHVFYKVQHISLVIFLSFCLFVFLCLLTNVYTSSGCSNLFSIYFSVCLSFEFRVVYFCSLSLLHSFFLSLSVLAQPSVNPFVCLFVCKVFTFSSFLQNHRSILTKLGTKHPLVKGIQVYLNKGPR